MAFANGSEIFPTQTVCDSEIPADAELVLGEEGQAIVVSGTLRISSGGRSRPVAQKILRQNIGLLADTCGKAIARDKGDEAALEVVVESINPCAPEFSAKLECMRSLDPCEVVEYLIILTDARARNTKSRGTKIVKNSVEIQLGQPSVPGIEIQAGLKRMQRIKRCKGIAETRIAKAQLVDVRGTQRREQARRDYLYARGRNLLETGNAGATTKTSERAQRKLLIALSEGVANCKGMDAIEMMIQLADKIIERFKSTHC